MKTIVEKVKKIILVYVIGGIGWFHHGQSLALPPLYQLGEVSIEGSGCPAGTARASITEDGNAISVLYDKFQVAGVKGANPPIIAKCLVKIPIRIKGGYKLQATKVDYRGFSILSDKVSAAVSTAGPMVRPRRGGSALIDKVETVIREPNEFFVSQVVNDTFAIRTCQSELEMTFETGLRLIGPSIKYPYYLSGESSAVIDSADISGTEGESLRIGIHVVPCD